MVPVFNAQKAAFLLTSIAVFMGLYSPQRVSGVESVEGRGGELKIAAASDLRFALADLVSAYERKSGVRVTVAYGASGTLYAQLRNGAPFDLFLSADAEYPSRLEEAGLALPDAGFDYAIGRLVLWYPARSSIEFGRVGIRGLLDAAVRRIAIANPEHAPYGRAAVEALRNLELYREVRTKLVFGENLAQAAQFVASGAADAGMIAESLARAPELDEKGDYVLIPAEAYPEMRQRGIIMKRARNIDAARQFRTWMTGPDGRAILKRWGFTVQEPEDQARVGATNATN